jgi:polar amino acid transport system substrate-binding protein
MKRRLQSIYTLVLASFLSVFLGAASASCEVRIGIGAEPYPPFAYKTASGEWTGWEIELARAVCAEMKEQCDFVEVAWDGIIPALTSKQIDVIWSSMSITAERSKVIDFTDRYYRTPVVIVGFKDGDKDISPAHLKGRTIGVQVSTIHQRYVEKHFGAVATVKTYQTQDEADQDLAAGRVDYVQSNAIAVDSFLKSEAGSCCELKATVPDDPDVIGRGVGGGVRKGDAELKSRLNAAIKGLRASGRYQTITSKYFGFDIYG